MNENKSSRYHRLKRRSAVLSAVATAGALLALLLSGGSAVLRDLAMRLSDAGAGAPATVVIYAVLFAIVQEVFAFPMAYYRSFALERRYGLSAEPFRAWLTDHVKAAAIGGLLAVAGTATVYFLIAFSPRWWWLVSAVVFIAAVAGLARLAPVVLLPLFYTFTPLGRESLRARLVSLSERAGIPVLGVYEWGLGEKTRRANAALVGTGATRRILVSDTLLADYTDDEIEVVLAHELAHHVHKDIPKTLIVEFVFLLAAFAVAAATLSLAWPRLALMGANDVAGLPLLLLGGGTVLVILTPVGHALSRSNERRADRFALELTGQAGAFMSAMRRLAAQNLAEEHPSRATLWLFHTHPPIEQRIEAARTFSM